MDSLASELPNDCGRRLLPVLIDEIAATNPKRRFISMPRTACSPYEFQDITYGTLARAVNRCSWWLEQSLGGRSQTFQAISVYLNPGDLRHAFLLLAAIKTGYKAFFSCPRNTVKTHLSLLDVVQCDILVTSETITPVARDIVSKRPMRVLFLPELDYWLQDSDVVIYPYNNTFDEACHDPFVVMHSSGSTGIPKVLHWAHGTVSAHDAFQLIPSLGGNPWIGQCWAGKRVFTSFPWVHAAGLLLLLPLAVFSGVTPVITGTWPADAKLVNSAHIHGNVSASFTPASILIELVKEPLWLDNLRRLDYLTWSGGTLAQNTGDLISTKTRLFGLFGSTECGYLPAELPAPEDWPYYKYSSVLRHEFRHSGDDLYELVIIRNPDERDPFQAIFATFPDLQEYSMRDLYLPHPTKEGWWRSCGRVDDVIAFADARKLNPTRLEAAIEAHPAIAAALICGQGQLQPALLLQPETHPATEDERARLLRDIWPAVERANHVGPVPGRLSERLVLFTAQEKPMARAGAKQTIQRKSTLHLYRDEIERLYAAAGAEGATVNGLTDRTSLRLSAGESPRDNSEGRTQLGT